MPKRICESVESAINSICWYNGYGAEILNLAEEIKKVQRQMKVFVGNTKYIQKNTLFGC
jgi:hypothetical protein|nr:MAG TPA: hypothetical protein [Caudoviricetes sp.]